MNVMTLHEVETNSDSFYYAEINLKEIPISSLSTKTRKQLSLMLNSRKILLSEEGDFRDWRGLFTRAGLDNSLWNFVEKDIDPTRKVLNIVEQEPLEKANLDRLQFILGYIGRWDIVDDLNNAFLEDARVHLTNQMHIENRAIVNANEDFSVDLISNKFEILTPDDLINSKMGLPKIKYDAFVLYADEDVSFAKDLVDRMEENGFKLFLKDRDLLGGVQFVHEAIMHVISERCHALIIIVSPDFFRSSANTFFTSYAQALNIEKGRNKIFPCLYRDCILPDTLKFYFVLNYIRAGSLYNFWDRLRESLERAALIDGRNINGRLTIDQSNRNNQQIAMSEQTKKRKLNEQKAKDRAMIEQINNSVQIHLPTQSASIEEIVDKLPTPPVTPPAAPPHLKSQSMWNLQSSCVESSPISKSQTNLADDRTSTKVETTPFITKPKTSSRIFRRFFNAKLNQKSPVTSETTTSTSNTLSTTIDSSSKGTKKKISLFRKKTDIQKL